jgi:23S rRNA pseudouridine2605 synthase
MGDHIRSALACQRRCALRCAFEMLGIYARKQYHASMKTKPMQEHTGERIAKVIARAGICSRREAEKLIAAGEVLVNNERISSPALNVTAEDTISVRGKLLAKSEPSRLWLYYKPQGLVTTHHDPEGRPTVFTSLPSYLPRVISVGRLDLNTEGLLLLTNDGALARHMELPSTGWRRRYRARVFGLVNAAVLEPLARGITVDGVKYAPIETEIETSKGRNTWVVVTLTEGKNREIRNVFEHIGCKVSRLIRTTYGPFQIGTLVSGEVKEVPRKVMIEQLGKVVKAKKPAR